MILKPRVLVSQDSDSWAAFATDAIGQEIDDAISKRGVCHVMLTGGKTAERLYICWATTFAWPLKNIRFYFGDERCVSPDHCESNYALVMKTFLARGVPSGCSIMRMEAENPDRESAAKAYEKLIPERIDVLLLGMGEDGHIASLFPHNSVLREDKRKVVPVTGPKPPCERLTITRKVIANARSIFLLATGAEKGKVLAEALQSEKDIHSLPIRLVLGGTWLLDSKAGNQIRDCSMPFDM